MLLPVNDWLYFECFSMRLYCNSQRRALIASSFVVWDAFCGVLAGMTLHAPLCCFVTNVFWSVAARTPSLIRYSSFAVPFIFFNFRYFEANRHSYLRLLMQSYRIFWILLDSGWFWFAISGAFARICTATYANLYKMCSSKICPNAFVSERSFGVFATFVLFCNNP